MFFHFTPKGSPIINLSQVAAVTNYFSQNIRGAQCFSATVILITGDKLDIAGHIGEYEDFLYRLKQL